MPAATTLMLRSSSQRVKKGRDIAGVLLGHTQIRHRRFVVDLWGILNPPQHVGSRVLQNAGDVRSTRDPIQRGPYQTDRASNARNRVTRCTSVVIDRRYSAIRIG